MAAHLRKLTPDCCYENSRINYFYQYGDLFYEVKRVTYVQKKSNSSHPCHVLWFEIMAMTADGLGFSLQHDSVRTGKAGGYIPTHRL